MKKEPMTPQGYQKLKDELDRLLKVERPQNVKAIAEARAHGDLSENAEYHAAKERQSFLEGRIQDLQSKIARAQVIDPSAISQNKIAFGATVKVLDVDTDEKRHINSSALRRRISRPASYQYILPWHDLS